LRTQRHRAWAQEQEPPPLIKGANRINTIASKIPIATLHHVAFEMPSLEAVMRGGGRLKEAGHPIEWGVGRHGPGNNVFAYFIGPEEMVIEYTAEVEQVDAQYKIGGPDDWTWKPGRNDQWGINSGPSKRMQDAHNVRFAEDIFHPA